MVFNLFNYKSSLLFGVDLGSHFVKICALQRVGRRYVLQNYAVVPTGEFQQHGVRCWARRWDIVTGVACIALPDAMTVRKNFNFHKNDASETLENKITEQLALIAPNDELQLCYDYQILPSPLLDEIEILFVATQQQDLQQRISLVRGFTVQMVEVESFTLERLLLEDEVVGLVDLGAEQWTLFVAEQKQIIYQRREVHGGVVEAVNVAGFVQRSLHYFYSAHTFLPINKFYLLGGYATTPDLLMALRTELRAAVAILNIGSHIRLHKRLDAEKFLQSAPLLAKSLALALRVNLW